ncbi:M3 family oligoendopeptidase [Candidatus Uhrbacteria bacterium]|nr:M3 family oligoendopeptidase [Candidatus Uhrbacteria bacterium]
MTNIPTRPARHFVSEKLSITAWSDLLPYYQDLSQRELASVDELKQWMRDRTELEAILGEDQAWRYIKMNIDTRDDVLKEKYTFLVEEIMPHIAPFDHALNKKVVESPFFAELDQARYKTYIRTLKKAIEIYREENIPLFTETAKKEQEYGSLAAAMTVEIDNETLTMQQAGHLLKGVDREKRESVYRVMADRRLQDTEALDTLLDELIALRQRIARNAGFDNYRDYIFVSMGRFDYTSEDCMNMHDSIASAVMPALNDFEDERKKLLDLDDYRPWDTTVDAMHRDPLKPFEGGQQLLDNSIACFQGIRPFFGECLSTMKAMEYLDLESKQGKAPGGFNYPLYEIGVPFIFMNAVGTQRDVETLMHEGGHAIHSFLVRELELNEFKSTPSEVAELASMSMELLSMHTWGKFYQDPEDLKRAREEQMKGSLDALPWIAAVDRFQHWMYTTEHTAQERREYWNGLMDTFGSTAVDWTGFENTRSNMWQKQLHIFEVPFYYIEYAIAQLGAIAMWRQFKLNGDEALDNYISALSLGYTKTIPEFYKAAGIEFNFSKEYIGELVAFVQKELEELS